MQEAFWQRRWARSEIAFHQLTVNPYLQRYLPKYQPDPAQIFVPLCGKSLDLLWLIQQGHSVLGVELSEQAVKTFFHEQELKAHVVQKGAFTQYVGLNGQLELLCGDFFQLTPQDTHRCQFLYDRAALIALPESMRFDYAKQINRLMPEGSQGLLIGLEYPQTQMDGPPFSVSEPEIRDLFGTSWDVFLSERQDAQDAYPRFQAQGLSFLYEPVYCLKKTPTKSV